MNKFIRYKKCPNPENELKIICNLYSNYCCTPSECTKQLLLNRILDLQPYVDFEILFEDINF